MKNLHEEYFGEDGGPLQEGLMMKKDGARIACIRFCEAGVEDVIPLPLVTLYGEKLSRLRLRDGKGNVLSDGKTLTLHGKHGNKLPSTRFCDPYGNILPTVTLHGADDFNLFHLSDEEGNPPPEDTVVTLRVT